MVTIKSSTQKPAQAPPQPTQQPTQTTQPTQTIQQTPQPQHSWKEFETNVSFNDVSWRLELNRRPPTRYRTGIHSFDAVFGGFSRGLNLLLGAPGTGKSTLMKLLLSRIQGTVIHVICETDRDLATATSPNTKIIPVDYRLYLPLWHKAVAELYAIINHFKPSVVAIDSCTTFLAGTTKAVSEADIREALFKMARDFEARGLPLVVTSEVRRHGSILDPAGGMAVIHCPQVVWLLEKERVKTPWDADRYSAQIEEYTWFISCIKDRDGVAAQGKRYIIRYVGGQLELSEAKISVPTTTVVEGGANAEQQH